MYKYSKFVAYTNVLAKYNIFFIFFLLAAPVAHIRCRVVSVSTVPCNFNFSLSLCNTGRLTASTEYSELDKGTLHPPAIC